MRVQVEKVIVAPRELVWEVLADWEGQVRWMVDALRVEVVSDHREGVGVVIRCPTDLLGFVTVDVMRVTWWDPGYRMAVRHEGRLIKGDAAFELDDVPGGTRVTWWEEVAAPLGQLGEFGGEWIVGPYVTRMFRHSLDALARLCETQATRAA